MAYNILNKQSTKKGTVATYVADNLSDLDNVNNTIGSKCYDITAKKMYAVDSNGAWHEVVTGSGGGGEDVDLGLVSAFSADASPSYLNNKLTVSTDSGLTLEKDTDSKTLVLDYNASDSTVKSVETFSYTEITNAALNSYAWYLTGTTISLNNKFSFSDASTFSVYLTGGILKSGSRIMILKYNPSDKSYITIAYSKATTSDIDRTSTTSLDSLKIDFDIESYTESLDPSNTYYFCITSVTPDSSSGSQPTYYGMINWAFTGLDYSNIYPHFNIKVTGTGIITSTPASSYTSDQIIDNSASFLYGKINY